MVEPADSCVNAWLFSFYCSTKWDPFCSRQQSSKLNCYSNIYGYEKRLHQTFGRKSLFLSKHVVYCQPLACVDNRLSMVVYILVYNPVEVVATIMCLDGEFATYLPNDIELGLASKFLHFKHALLFLFLFHNWLLVLKICESDGVCSTFKHFRFGSLRIFFWNMGPILYYDQ